MKIDLVQMALQRRSRYSGFRQKADRMYHLLRTFSCAQILLRFRNRCRAKMGWWYQPKATADQVATADLKAFAELFDSTLPTKQVDLELLREGRVELLNETHSLGTPFRWDTPIQPRPSHLWRFQLHYHEFLLALAADSATTNATDEGLQFAWETIRHWIQTNSSSNPACHQDAWHPYCISRRLPVWYKLIPRFRQAAYRDLGGIELSAFRQAEYLSRNLETDLRGNHLLENLHALGMSGCFFEGPIADQWRQIARRGLEQELEAQVLKWGEHFERSPMYHCVVTSNLLQLGMVSRTRDQQLFDLVTQYTSKMLPFLESILYPDGEIPLLADSCFGEAPGVRQIKTWADRVLEETSSDQPTPNTTPSNGARRVGDYWVARRETDFLMMDAGPVAGKGLPAHGHCDLLNVVGAINGARFLVDSGNGSYNLDKARAYCRSSVAHNVLTIDQRDHCDVWSKFRMGYAGQPGELTTGEESWLVWAMSEHDAYRDEGIPRVVRWLGSLKDDLLWICLDWIPVLPRTARLEGFLHFAPEVTLEPDDKPVLNHQGSMLQIEFLNVDQWQPADSSYFAEFGKCIANQALAYSSSSSGESVLGWSLSPSGASRVQLHGQPQTGYQLSVELQTGTHQFKLPFLTNTSS